MPSGGESIALPARKFGGRFSIRVSGARSGKPRLGRRRRGDASCQRPRPGGHLTTKHAGTTELDAGRRWAWFRAGGRGPEGRLEGSKGRDYRGREYTVRETGAGGALSEPAARQRPRSRWRPIVAMSAMSAHDRGRVKTPRRWNWMQCYPNRRLEGLIVWKMFLQSGGHPEGFCASFSVL